MINGGFCSFKGSGEQLEQLNDICIKALKFRLREIICLVKQFQSVRTFRRFFLGNVVLVNKIGFAFGKCSFPNQCPNCRSAA